ncbi:hypothetical protein BSNT_06452 [Bacillus subtilis subsp. natto BEST195]|nr:hypothetical protein BSNT_06452 [Bacillus subtilis subsp. natto BEST195]
MVWDHGVAGSNPVFPTIFYGALAQLGERLLCTQEVSGSIPLGSTKSFFKKVVDFEEVTLYTNKVALTKRTNKMIFEN